MFTIPTEEEDDLGKGKLQKPIIIVEPGNS